MQSIVVDYIINIITSDAQIKDFIQIITSWQQSHQNQATSNQSSWRSQIHLSQTSQSPLLSSQTHEWLKLIVLVHGRSAAKPKKGIPDNQALLKYQIASYQVHLHLQRQQIHLLEIRRQGRLEKNINQYHH